MSVGDSQPMTKLSGGRHVYLEAFVAASDDVMFGIDADGIIQFCNAAAEAAFGYAAAELVGQSVRLLIPPERDADEEAVFASVLRGELAAPFTTVRIAKGGRRIHVNLGLAAVRDRSGAIVGVSQIARDLAGPPASTIQAYLAAIVESSDDVIVSKDLDGIVTSCNPAVERVFGYPPAELIGRSIRVLIPPDRQTEEDEILAKLRRGERIDHFETVRIAKDGRLVDVSLSVSPVRDASGAVVGVAKIARDITERKRAAAELALQQEWFRVTLASIGDAVIASDAAGNVTYMNSTAEALTGWPLADAANQPLADVFQIVNERTRQPVENPVALVMRSGEVVGLANHTLLIGRDGTERPIADSGAPIRDADGRILGVVLVFRDATEQRRAEEAIAEQREWLETTLESIGDAVIATDVRGQIVFMNPIAEHLTGWRGPDVHGRPCTEVFNIVNEHTRRPVENPVTRVLAEGTVVGLANHTLLIAADGTERPIDDSGAPIRNHDGRIVGVVLVFRDVTDRRRAEVERHAAAAERERLLDAERIARTEAERASRVKDEFVAMVSHELRTPLNAILGWTQLMMRSRHDPAVVERGLDVVARNTRLQAQLISDLLDISRIVSGKLLLDVQSVALASVVTDAIESVQPEAAAKGIEIRRTLGDGVGQVAGDPGRLQQIVWNLLSNAIKFTPRGGHIDVTLRRVDSRAEITVTDTGAGINAEFLPHIFDRFHQADRSITRRFGGLGLGLSIVKHLVELHGGTALVDSPGEGHGATFTIRLPTSSVVDAPDVTMPTANANETFQDVPLDGIRVLLVEDEADTREFVIRLLETHRARVVAAASAAEALSLFAADVPDIVVSDIGLPGVDGYDLMEQIRRKSVADGGGVPAIALTAYARSEDRTRALLAGYQAHLAKPVEPSELVATVASFVDLIAAQGGKSTD
jgi:PAS domain S-box-containing protein